MILILGAWLAVLMMALAVVQAVRLFYVPAGAYGPWRLAWGGLVLTTLTIGVLALRNALVLSGPNPMILPDQDDGYSWLIHTLLNFSVRTVLHNLAALGLLVCTTACYRIFRYRHVPSAPSVPPIPVAQVIMGWDGKIVSWNTAAVELLGWSEAEALGKELPDVIIPPDLMVEYHGEQMLARDAHRLGLQHFQHTGESRIMNTRFDTIALCKDGHQIEVEVRVTRHLSGIRETFMGQLVQKPPAPRVPVRPEIA